MANILPGEYVFKITTTLRNSELVNYYKIEVIDPCPTAVLTVDPNFSITGPF